MMENEMTKELTADQLETLRDKLMDLEIESIMDDKDKLLALVYEHVVGNYENKDEVEILEMAEYYGVEVE